MTESPASYRMIIADHHEASTILVILGKSHAWPATGPDFHLLFAQGRREIRASASGVA